MNAPTGDKNLQHDRLNTFSTSGNTGGGRPRADSWSWKRRAARCSTLLHHGQRLSRTQHTCWKFEVEEEGGNVIGIAWRECPRGRGKFPAEQAQSSAWVVNSRLRWRVVVVKSDCERGEALN